MLRTALKTVAGQSKIQSNKSSMPSDISRRSFQMNGMIIFDLIRKTLEKVLAHFRSELQAKFGEDVDDFDVDVKIVEAFFVSSIPEKQLAPITSVEDF